MSVRLKFAAEVASFISGRIWLPTQKLRKLKDGSIELTMKTNGWKELVRFVLSWQPDVEVISPEKLRKRVREKMQTALGN